MDNMTPAALLHLTRSLGFRVGADADYARLIVIGAEAQMPPTLLAALTAAKPDLLVLLRAETDR
jgi:hypothetical protein